MDEKNDIEDISDNEKKDDENRTNNQTNISESNHKNPGTGDYEDAAGKEDEE
jgi:hypothetical protein